MDTIGLLDIMVAGCYECHLALKRYFVGATDPEPVSPAQGVSGIAGRGVEGGEGGRNARSRAEGGSSICAVLGPSGAGKTTLIDILAGRKSDAGGNAA